jgi:hypothetical protein
MWLVVVDTMQIQPYIFGSNRLRENVGASYLVDAATRNWAFEAVEAVAKEAGHGKTNIESKNKLMKDSQDNTQKDPPRIENGLLDAEVWYSGGGNFVVFFKDEKQVKLFNHKLSEHALREAPGLQLVIAQEEIDLGKEVLRDKLDKVMHELALKKRNHAWSAPLLGLSVTLPCRSTGLPATEMIEGIRGEPDYPASDEIRAKVDIATPEGSSKSLADQRLQDVIGQKEGYRYPADFDDLGATAGEYSYIAIVHADGNGMGKRIREIGDLYATVDENRDFILELRKFSINVEDAARQALKAVLDKLVERIDDKDKAIVHQLTKKTSIRIELEKKDNEYYLPFRPIVFGGDDVTFVCDGRLGLSLATMYLEEFEKRAAAANLGKDDRGLTACAGVAIVKSHYPFARAYQLTTDLTGSAKSYRSKLVKSAESHGSDTSGGSCLDWHFALSGLSGSIEEIREREYKAGEGDWLTLRPVTLKANPKEGQHAWPVVLKGIEAFQKEEWVERRNKIKALRDALREGPSAVEHFRTAFNKGAELPEVLPAMGAWPSAGWHGKYCGYFDAIELADWFIPLEREAGNETPTTIPAP